MKILYPLAILGFIFSLGVNTSPLPTTNSTNQIKKRYASNSVSYDPRSLSLNGKRIFIQSGEFHPFRLPVTSLWKDVLQKMQAAGMNTVSIYTHWGLINPAPGVFDFTGFNDLSLFLTTAQSVGLWVIVRPGPYINAESAAGGIPGWVTTIAGPLRSNATDYTAAWKPYIQAIVKILVPFQIDNGGPVIFVQVENEFYASSTNGQTNYFQNIKTTMQSNGIIVPLTFNDAAMNNQYATGSVSADIYGFDSYPQGFNCAQPQKWAPVVQTYRTYHQSTDPKEPLYLAEFQGGSYTNGLLNSSIHGAVMDESCRNLTGGDFESVFYKSLWAANTKLSNLYMIYGGTNWGYLAFPGVYTSYDYGAAIAETRQLTPKYNELKRQSLFLRSVPQFYGTDWVSDSTSIPGAYVTTLKNYVTGSGFTIVRQADSTATGVFTFKLPIVTPTSTNTQSVTLHGRQAKVITNTINYGNGSSYHYTTAEILFAGTIGSRDVLFLYGNIGDNLALDLYTAPSSASTSGPATFTVTGTTLYFSTPTAGISVLNLPGGGLLVFSDIDTAGTFWNPLVNQTSGSFSNYFNYGTTSTVLVGGPYLVRAANISGNTLLLDVDLDALATTPIIVIAPSSVTSAKINNGGTLTLISSPLNNYGILLSSISPSQSNLNVFPTLNNWKYADSLPEMSPTFDDSTWATITSTGANNNPTAPLFGALRLYACEYGFCEGEVLYRGYFVENGQNSLKIAISGGTAAAGSIWLNGNFVGSTFDALAHTFTFPNGSLVIGGSNVVTVLTDNMGQEEGYQQPKSPRGIIGYALVGGSSDFTSWKIQGKIGGNTNFPDTVRKIFNAGGLYADRQFYPNPGYNTSTWPVISLSDGIHSATVGFYRTDFSLALPTGYDFPVVLNVGGLAVNDMSQGFRSNIWVNGWKVGRFISYLGPQTAFVVPPGILNLGGTNTIALSVWATSNNGAAISSITLSTNAIYSWNTDSISNNNPA